MSQGTYMVRDSSVDRAHFQAPRVRYLGGTPVCHHIGGMVRQEMQCDRTPARKATQSEVGMAGGGLYRLLS
jgi:hypothetical protein